MRYLLYLPVILTYCFLLCSVIIFESLFTISSKYNPLFSMKKGESSSLLSLLIFFNLNSLKEDRFILDNCLRNFYQKFVCLIVPELNEVKQIIMRMRTQGSKAIHLEASIKQRDREELVTRYSPQRQTLMIYIHQLGQTF